MHPNTRIFTTLWLTVSGALASPTLANAKTWPLPAATICSNPATPVASTYPSGKGLYHPEIIPIFWGHWWSNNPAQVQARIADLQSILNGPYLSALSQYAPSGWGKAPARMVPAAPVYQNPTSNFCNTVPPGDTPEECCKAFNPNAPNTTGDGPCVQAVTSIINQIAGQTDLIPEVESAVDALYVVFLPGDVKLGNGFNSTASFQGVKYNYLFVPNWYTNNDPTQGFNVGGIQATLSHELVEALTDDYQFANCSQAGNGTPVFQVADVCGGTSETQNGVNLSPYWSAADGKCVIPEGWQGIWEYNPSWNPPTQEIVPKTVRQVYSGWYGGASPAVVYTDTNDDVWLTTGPNAGARLGLGAPMFGVVSGSNPGVIATNGSKISVFNVAQNLWAPQINPPGGTATGVYSAGKPMATDTAGNAYYLSGSSQWVQFSGPGDEFMGSGVSTGGQPSVVQLGWAHEGWYLYSFATGDWTWVASNTASDVYASDGSDLIAWNDQYSPSNLFTYSPTTPSAVLEGGRANAYAVGGFGRTAGLWSLIPNRTQVFQSKNPLVKNSGWNLINGSAGRVVGGGPNETLVLTGCAHAQTCAVY